MKFRIRLPSALAAACCSIPATPLSTGGTEKLRHVFLVGGCDGSRDKRSYYTDLAMAVPKDCLILTLACGKYRFNKLDFGTLEGLPRLLDVGQCNDSYSAIVLAVKLAEKLNCGVNDLPLSLILSGLNKSDRGTADPAGARCEEYPYRPDRAGVPH